MKSFYKELEKAKRTLITKLNNEIGQLSDLWFAQDITDQEYCVRFENLKNRIKELQG